MNKEEEEKKDYSHFFISQDEKGNIIPHPDRHTIAPEGSTFEMTSKEVTEVLIDHMESDKTQAKDQIIDIESKKSKN